MIFDAIALWAVIFIGVPLVLYLVAAWIVG
jgi:hypothetical protein